MWLIVVTTIIQLPTFNAHSSHSQHSPQLPLQITNYASSCPTCTDPTVCFITQSKKQTKRKRARFTNAARDIALEYSSKNKSKSYDLIVRELRKEYPDRCHRCDVLTIDTLKAWRKRYKGANIQRLKVAKGQRVRNKVHPQLQEAVFNEILYRDENNIQRDVETTQASALETAQEFGFAVGEKCDNFKASRKFMQSVIDGYELQLRKETGTNSLSWAEYLIARRTWLET